MQFKIDENLNRVADAMVAPVDPETVAAELCRRMIDAGMIEDKTEYWGESVLVATGPRYVKDICAVLAGYLYGDKNHLVPSDVFDAFCNLIVMGDGDCPECGGGLVFDEIEGREVKNGDYMTPNDWEIDNYVYYCANCGAIYKTPKEL